MSDSTTTPLKRCRMCKEKFPPTSDYFYKDKWRSDGLDSACKSCQKERHHQYQLANPDKTRVHVRRYQQANPNKIKEKNRRYQQSNPDKIREYSHQYRARKYRLAHTLTAQDWIRALEYFGGVCAYCGNPPSLFDVNTILHQEHFIAVNNDGGYTPDNIIPACQSCNISKHDTVAEKWLVSKFGKRRANKILAKIYAYFEEVSRV